MAQIKPTPSLPMLAPDDYDMEPNSWDYAKHSVTSSVGDVLGATFDDAWYYSPTSSLMRSAELSQYGQQSSGGQSRRFKKPKQRNEEDYFSEEEWRDSEHFRNGLSFKGGVHKEVARIVAERFDEREARNKILANAPDSNWLKAGQFATSFVASSLDPINIATAFIPVGGALRVGANAAKSTRYMQRFAHGAKGGAIGTALTEPLVLSAAQQEQSDYDMQDVLMSVAFGATLGGAFSVAGGAVKDKWGKATPEEVKAHVEGLKEQISNTKNKPVSTYQAPLRDLSPEGHLNALRTVLAQMEDGRAIDVKPLLEAEGFFELNKPNTTTLPYKQSEPVRFNSQREAKRFIEKGKQEGNIDKDQNVRAIQDKDGSWSLHEEHDGYFDMNDSKVINVFNKMREAKTAINKLSPQEKEKAHVIQLGAGRDKQFVIARNVSKATADNIQDWANHNKWKADELENKEHFNRQSFKQYMPELKTEQQRIESIHADIQRNHAQRDAIELPEINTSKVQSTTEGSIKELELEIAELDAYHKQRGLVVDEETAELDVMLNNMDKMDELINAGVQCLART